ncbi:unnamed protein product [Hermetia illucens]|uniref:HTH CENPB-type domain-containing protein n=1 Tax=Hermetia illucens TaxID=343691 RepID=A0A7R8Z291_HERIL|nr:unnamed protein product [Hermetia illucens]
MEEYNIASTNLKKKKPKSGQLDSALYLWFSDKIFEGKPITRLIIVEQAKQVQQNLNIDLAGKFSEGWLRHFKIIHGIRKLDISGELKSVGIAATEELKVKFKSIVSENGLTPCQIYNPDETDLLWRCLSNSTLVGGDEKNVKGFKKNKDQLTVLQCSNSSENHKLVPFMIGK